MSALSSEDPGVFAAAALRGVDDKRTWLKGDAGKATRDDGDFFAVIETIRPQIDVAPGHALCRRVVRGNDRERHDWLSDEVARFGNNFFAEGLDFAACGAWTHQHAIAAGL